MRSSVIVALLGLLLAVATVVPLHAQRPENPLDTPRMLLDQWEADAEEITADIEQDDLDFDLIDDLRARLATDIVQMGEFVARLDAELAPLISQLDALGPAPAEGATEGPDLARERARLTGAIEEREGLKRRTGQAIARANALVSRLVALRRQIFMNTLLDRGPSLLEPNTLATGVAALGQGAQLIVSESRAKLAEEGIAIGAGLVVRVATPFLIILVALFGFRQMRDVLIKRLSAQINPSMTPSRRLAVAAGLTATRLFLPILTLGVVFTAAAASGLLGMMGLSVLVGVAISTTLVIGAYALGSAFFSPRAPELRISALGDRDAMLAQRWLIVLAAIYGLDWILVVEGKDLGIVVEALTLFNTVLQILGGIALWNLVSVIRHSVAQDAQGKEDGAGDSDDGGAEPAPPEPVLVPILLRVAGIALRAVAVIAPLLALSGYFAASRFVFHPPIASAALISFFVLLSSVVREVVEGVFASSAAGSDTRQRLRLIPVLVGFLLTAVALPLLALIWGANTVDLIVLWRRIGEGFLVGELRISPAVFLYFAIVFAIGFLITRLIQGILLRSVLPFTNLDTGVRAAVIAGTGYIGVLLSVLIAISTAGIDLSNLAIVAGALSVGIGFGLQNIVNNFVSGLILLVERPIKAGDWIEIPSGTGYVKQINVRSTEIETFDRSSLIVPNSELISATVTNYTHNNLQGRLIAKVGVAYGTDTRRVEAILLEIARAHPMVLRRPAPWVNFAGFGDSSLDFEIRAILRDVNWTVSTRSDLYHEIARRFTAEGIVIPFPQRDVNFSNPAALAAALGAAPSAQAKPAENAPGPSRRRTRRKPDETNLDAPSGGDGQGDADGR